MSRANCRYVFAISTTKTTGILDHDELKYYLDSSQRCSSSWQETKIAEGNSTRQASGRGNRLKSTDSHEMINRVCLDMTPMDTFPL